MKKRLAQWFLLVAKRFDPDIVIENYKQVKDYVPKKLGLSIEIKKQDVRKFRDESGLPEAQAKKAIVEDAKVRISNEILKAVCSNGLIEFDIRKRGCGYVVEGDLKVNVPCQ